MAPSYVPSGHKSRWASGAGHLLPKPHGRKAASVGGSEGPCAPALSQMVAGMARSAVAKASMARLRLPGVLAAPSPTTCTPASAVAAADPFCLWHQLSKQSPLQAGAHPISRLPAKAKSQRVRAARVLGQPSTAACWRALHLGHLHLWEAAAIDDARVLHRLAQHAQRVVQAPLGLVQHVRACRSSNFSSPCIARSPDAIMVLLQAVQGEPSPDL
jgi:hypothetical protein